MENEIKEFFQQTAPQPSDPTAFKLELNARLAAVEQIKAYRDREIRRSRKIALALFIAGLVLGGATAVFFILHPVKLPAISWLDALSLSPWLWLLAAPITLIPLLLARRHRYMI